MTTPSPSRPSDKSSWPVDRPELLPFVPLVHTAWVDGVLTPAGMHALRAHIDAQAWIGADDSELLRGWLDPDTPPEPDELRALEALVRGVELPGTSRAAGSLTDLGLELASARASGDGPWSDTAAVEGLRALEAALGVAGHEAVRKLLGTPVEPTRQTSRTASFEPGALHAFLDRDHRELRAEVMALLRRPPVRVTRGHDTPAYRRAVLGAVSHLGAAGYGSLAFPEAYGGRGDPGGSLAVFETLAFGDLSVLVKFGVQFGLFGGSVLQLGTARHHEALLGRIGSGELLGCYAMTETAHGSNVRDLETTATLDATTGELVVDTPRPEAAKDYIGNAALHGRMATVFARLRVGGEDHGVHALLVPIRDEAGSPLPGIAIEDCGEKEGLNGVDNGRLSFSLVRVPTENLLDRFAAIDEHGVYSSPIPGAGRRFFTTLSTLVAGRVSIAAASVSAAKRGLTITIRYADGRRQFGPEGGEEVPVLDYLVVQRALLPRLATTYGLHFAVRRLQRRYADPEPNDAEVEVTAAGLKAYASAHCADTLQACREACGGRGYLAESGLGPLKADTDVFTTFEGANPVLLQLVSRGLLSSFRREMGDLRFWDVVRHLAERAETRLTELNPVVTRSTSDEHLLDPAFHLGALRYREERLLRSVARRLRARIGDGGDAFQAMNECQDHLVELALAHVERGVLDCFQDAVGRAPGPGLSEILGSLAALFALSRIHDQRGWYLEVGYLEAAKSKAIGKQVNALCREIRRCVPFLVDAFGIPSELLPEMAAGDPS